LAEENSASRQIDETEAYLGLLRAKKAMIQVRVSEAEEQLGMVKEVLDSDGIAEGAQSDDEVFFATSPPRSSDFVSIDTDSESDSDHSDSTPDTSVDHFQTLAHGIAPGTAHCMETNGVEG
jgi:hypothetical protein